MSAAESISNATDPLYRSEPLRKANLTLDLLFTALLALLIIFYLVWGYATFSEPASRPPVSALLGYGTFFVFFAILVGVVKWATGSFTRNAVAVAYNAYFEIYTDHFKLLPDNELLPFTQIDRIAYGSSPVYRFGMFTAKLYYLDIFPKKGAVRSFCFGQVDSKAISLLTLLNNLGFSVSGKDVWSRKTYLSYSKS